MADQALAVDPRIVKRTLNVQTTNSSGLAVMPGVCHRLIEKQVLPPIELSGNSASCQSEVVANNDRWMAMRIPLPAHHEGKVLNSQC